MARSSSAPVAASRSTPEFQKPLGFYSVWDFRVLEVGVLGFRV